MIKFISSTLTVIVFLALYTTEVHSQELRVRLNDAISNKGVMVEPLNTNDGVFFGANAGRINVGSSNTFIGDDAGFSNEEGTQNTFVGKNAGAQSKDAHFNTIVGSFAGPVNTTGTSNTFLGQAAGNLNTEGSNNTYIGRSAGAMNVSGSGNVFLGANAGWNETGSNKLYIENFNLGPSEALIYGDFQQKSLQVNGSLGINQGISGTTLNIKAQTTDTNIFTLQDKDDNDVFQVNTNGDILVDGLIKGVEDPVMALDAANRRYVDLASDALEQAQEVLRQSVLALQSKDMDLMDAIPSYAIGDFAHGGIVFWVDETGQHGLVCAKTDQSTGIRWHAGANGNTRAKGDGIYAGKMNTSITISSQVALGDDGGNYAAQLCNDLAILEGGTTFGDWYLPSIFELGLMHQNEATINSSASAHGGANAFSGSYWSSTELISNMASKIDFSNGGAINPQLKQDLARVRAIRSF